MSPFNDLTAMVWDLADFKSRANVSLLVLAALSVFVLYYFSLSLLLSIGWYCVAGVFGQVGCVSLSPCVALTTSVNNTNTTNNNK